MVDWTAAVEDFSQRQKITEQYSNKLRWQLSQAIE